MEIFNVFSMNGIENYPAAGGNFLENVILKVKQTHFSKDFYPWKRGGGGCEVPCAPKTVIGNTLHSFTNARQNHNREMSGCDHAL